MKIHLLWDFLTGSILQLLITPAVPATLPTRSLRRSPRRVAVAVRPRLLLSGSVPEPHAAGASGSRGSQHGTSVFDALASSWRVAIPAAADRAGPIDVSVLLGVSHRLPCRLIALRVPQEVADRRRQKAYVKAQKHGRVPSREYLEWQDWTILRDRLRAGVADVRGRRRALPRSWQIELMF